MKLNENPPLQSKEWDNPACVFDRLKYIKKNVTIFITVYGICYIIFEVFENLFCLPFEL